MVHHFITDASTRSGFHSQSIAWPKARRHGQNEGPPRLLINEGISPRNQRRLVPVLIPLDHKIDITHQTALDQLFDTLPLLGTIVYRQAHYALCLSLLLLIQQGRVRSATVFWSAYDVTSHSKGH